MQKFKLAKEYFLDGCILLEAEKFSQAEDRFKKSLELIPDRSSTLTNLSVAQLKLKKYDEAKISAQKAIEFEGDNSEAYLNLGLIEQEFKCWDSALKCFDKALELKKDYYEAWSNKGNILKELKRYEEAILHFDKALNLKPNYAEAYSNKGNVLSELKYYDKAIELYDKAISLRSDYAEAYSNKGLALVELNYYQDAIANYEKAIQLNGDYWDAYWNKACAQLTIGDFTEGWKNYEYRWRRVDSEAYRHSNIPLLQNLDDIYQKKILVWCDQFYGDSIQFSRYINVLTAMGANIFFEVKAPLIEVFKNSFQGCKIFLPGDSFPRVEYQISTSSLPLLFKTTLQNIPEPFSYLKSSCQSSRDWGEILNLNGNKLNIALACSGNTTHFKNDKNRPIGLEKFEPLLDIANLFLVQMNIEDSDKDFLNCYPEIKFLGSDIKSFNDTAAIIQKMDLTISIDTSIAHLSGALGKKTWVLLSWVSDWRWLLDRADSPWYPSVRLYRQPKIGDWNGVLEKVTSDLRDMASS